ncbi:hypothetical protein CBR_g49202 [Chara braunii]|uniref:Uncharacterized protein n=1 Tax=Chara braunii TaxID=69332 RepID=A0A388M4L3_CHABU|nr:hypothetical protein CBR_g49202 [Chara braunii]|eukprot:GBG89412.1 hypothetical protein CBR_g49202 [Chara braunii]
MGFFFHKWHRLEGIRRGHELVITQECDAGATSCRAFWRHGRAVTQAQLCGHCKCRHWFCWGISAVEWVAKWRGPFLGMRRGHDLVADSGMRRGCATTCRRFGRGRAATQVQLCGHIASVGIGSVGALLLLTGL